jgi:hypothetical protein
LIYNKIIIPSRTNIQEEKKKKKKNNNNNNNNNSDRDFPAVKATVVDLDG